jgi:hypothetical protein
LSRATLDACEERRDQAERRESKLFHKSLRLLNITKVSLLQASTETPAKLFSRPASCRIFRAHLRSRPRKDKRGVDLIADALPFGRLWYTEVSDAVE